MDELSVNAITLGAALGLLALLGLPRRSWLSLPVALAALAFGVVRGLLSPSLLPDLHVWGPALEVAAWLALSVATVRAGGPWTPSAPTGVVALVVGALAGPWAAAALLSVAIDDRRALARAVLVATAAAVALSPAAHPTRLTVEPALTAMLLPGALAAAVAWPRGRTAQQGRSAVTAVLLLVALGCALLPQDTPALLAGAAAMMSMRSGSRRTAVRAGGWLWLAGVVAVLVVAQLAGTLHQAALGAHFLAQASPPLGAVGAALGSAALHASLGVAGAGVLLGGLTQSMAVPFETELPVLLVGGAATGGLVAASYAAGWRAALGPWLAQVLAVSAWAAWLSLS